MSEMEIEKKGEGKPFKCKKCGKAPNPKSIEQAIKFYSKYHWKVGQTSEVWIICEKCENEVKITFKCVEFNNNRIGFQLLGVNKIIDENDLKLIKE